MTADNIAGQVAGAEVPSLALAWGEGICETTSHALVVVVSLSLWAETTMPASSMWCDVVWCVLLRGGEREK